MLHDMALVIFSLNKIAGSLFHSFMTDKINHDANDTSTKTARLYIMKDSINNLSFLSYHLLTYRLRVKKITYEKKLTSDCKPLTTSN